MFKKIKRKLKRFFYSFIDSRKIINIDTSFYDSDFFVKDMED